MDVTLDDLVREQPQEGLPGRLRRLLRREQFAPRARNRCSVLTNEKLSHGRSASPVSIRQAVRSAATGRAEASRRSLRRFLSWRPIRRRRPQANLPGADDVRRGSRSCPPAKQYKSICGVAERERGDEDPDIDIAPATDAPDEAIDVRNVI